MSKTEVMELATVCQSFPRLVEPQVERDNILNAIDMMFAGEAQVLVVEGLEGIGKTTLLAQFVRRNPKHAISLFIKPTSHWAYDPAILKRDLCNQIHWILHQEELRPSEIISDDIFHNYISALLIKARWGDFYFVVDGLHEIPQENEQVREIILDMLPWGMPGCRLLFAGEAEQFPKQRMHHIVSKIFQLPPFSFDETKRFLNDLGLDEFLIEKIHRAYKGIPSKIASARRILFSNAQILMEYSPNLLNDPYQIEWHEVDFNDAEQIMLLAIVAHELRDHTLTGLSRVLDITIEKAAELIQDLNFVFVDPQDGVVSFVTEEFRRFASVQLRYLKEKVNDLLIKELLKDPEGDTALIYLPEYFGQAGKTKELIEYLSPERFTKLIECTQSLSVVRQKADLGVRAALELHRDDDLLRFTIQDSIILDLDKADVWRSEIEARMALGDYRSALALAQRTNLKEDHLHLLAIIVKVKLEHNITPELELMEQIRQLYKQIDKASLGERAIDIAADLFYSHRDLAIDLVEKATASDLSENALDWAFARLSLAASKAGKERIPSDDTVVDIRSRIKDPEARNFSAAASVLLEEYSANEIINEVEKLDSAVEKMFLLRQWTLDNQRRDDACDVIDFALQFAVKTTRHAFNARDYREIASPLPFISDSSKAKQFVSILDSLKSTIEHIGPTEDYVRLQLTLVRTEYKYEFEAALDRVIDVYLYIDDLNDLTTKANCLARLAALLMDIDPQGLLNRKDNIHTYVYSDLQEHVQLILDTTGDHYEVTRKIIQPLAKTKPDLALDFAMKLNTENRRDKALLDIIKSSLKIPLNRVDLHFVDEVWNKLEDQELKDEAALKVIERFFREDNGVDVEVMMPQVLQFINRIDGILDVVERCKAYCLAYCILVKSDRDKYASYASHLLRSLDTTWQAIDEGWFKVNNGFKIAESLAEVSPEIGQTYIDKTESARNEILISSSGAAETYIRCLCLAIRAYAGLLPNGIATQYDLERLDRLIDRLPSYGDRAILWADLALRCYSYKKSDECEQIVIEHVRPLIEDISSDNFARKIDVIILTAPALYHAHPKTALELISKLPRKKRDAAYTRIASFILDKVSITDPYNDSHKHGYDIDYEEALDIIDLMPLMEADVLISYFIECIADSIVVGRHKGGKFAREQQNSIAHRLQDIIDKKLPNPRYIKHEGYKILCRAQILRIYSEDKNTPQQWLNLIEDARSIPNLNDKAYVLCKIATIIPPEKFARKQILQEAKGIADTIPVLLERVALYNSLASSVADVDIALFKQYLEIAMQATLHKSNNNIFDVQKDIIDLACQRDPDFAASLASSVDDDSARRRLNRRIQIYTVKETMVDQRGFCEDKEIAGIVYSQAAWKALKSLNTGRVETVHLEHTREFVRIASTLPWEKSYPIFAWVVENAVQRFARTDQARSYLRPQYEAVLLGVELAGRMAMQDTISTVNFRDIVQAPNNTSLVLQPGDREKAIQFLKDWFEYEVQEYLKIQDPYFGLKDLEFLKLLLSVNPKCEVYILTGLKSQEKTSKSLKDAYREHWRFQVSDQRPPDTEIIIVGNQEGIPPFHDRWLVTKRGGLRLGTSLNSLGRKVSDISRISLEEASEREHILDQYLILHKKDSDEGKLQYETFTL